MKTYTVKKISGTPKDISPAPEAKRIRTSVMKGSK